ncbi:unnamed protein product [Rotaria socialis]|uniref:Uncharacterized protein n=1 Tax=Rotaria socialis TaxID=392032 RepID=A0A820RT62_9BILA|nr:unnamed protein product [Rotaria socialis]CAF3621946.1 unnamed protein product [Rotaria socialis]CAF3786605.1 unnamed protein product [Rotaria socialis]CAF4442057.1 unnamed protein product [Rotaria socialis]CAF4490362.1 unnamed protein product [Rotaria socialis]
MDNHQQNTTTLQSQSVLNNNAVDLDDENNMKTTNEIPTIDSNRNSIDDQVITSVCDSTNESAASINDRNTIKTTRKSHQQAAQDQFPNEDENKKHRQRSVSVSSSSSSTSTDNETSNIPYETLHNEDEDDQSDHITP